MFRLALVIFCFFSGSAILVAWGMRSAPSNDKVDNIAGRPRQIISSQPSSGISADHMVVFDAQGMDFGRIPQLGEPVIKEIGFQNLSDSRIRVVGVKTSCGCSAGSYSKEWVQSKGSGRVTIRLDPSIRSLGQFTIHATVALETAGGETDRHDLAMKGEVYDPVTLHPRNLAFGDFLKGNPKSLTVGLINNLDSPVAIKEVSSTQGHLSAAFEGAVLQPHAQTQCSVRLADTVPVGALTDSLVIKTDNPAAPTLRLAAKGVCRAFPVFAQCDRLAFGVVNPEQDTFRVLHLVHLAGEPFQVTGVQTEGIPLKAVWSDTPQARQEVRLTVAKDAELRGQQSGLVRLTVMAGGTSMELTVSTSGFFDTHP